MDICFWVVKVSKNSIAWHGRREKAGVASQTSQVSTLIESFRDLASQHDWHAICYIHQTGPQGQKKVNSSVLSY